MTREEAINEIKSWAIPSEKGREVLETLIPELRESEDEKNANALIRLLNNEKVSLLITFEAKQQWIDWLERKKIPSVSFEPAAGFDSGSAVVYHNDESEDERIRKEIISAILSGRVYDTDLMGAEHIFELDKEVADKWLAYLEKQKEVGIQWLKSDNVENPDKPYIDKAGMFYTTDGRMCYASEIEKQKEQIPYTDFVIKSHKGDDNNPYDMRESEAQEYAIKRGFDIPFNDGEVYVDERHMTQTIGNILRWADEHPKEQKSAEWSEEDEKMLVSFLHKVEVCDLLTNKDYAWIVKRLKSLRPQPKQEWSEKDSDVLLQTAAILKDYFDSDEKFEDCDYDCETLAGKLLEMRYRISPSWKPSEEQMGVLKKALYINPASGKLHELKENEVCILQGLLKQLEKL